MPDILIDSVSRQVIYVAADGETIDVQADKTAVTGGDHTRQFPQSSVDSEVVTGAATAPDDFVGGDKFLYDSQGNWVVNPDWTGYEDPDSPVLSGLCFVVKLNADGLRTHEIQCMDVDEDGVPIDVVQQKIFIYEKQDLVRTSIERYDAFGNLIKDQTLQPSRIEESEIIYRAL